MPYSSIDPVGWGGRDLVKMLVEYHSLCAGPHWGAYLDAPPENAPRAFRFARIKSLCAALGLPENLHSVIRGEFLIERDEPCWEDARAYLQDLFPEVHVPDHAGSFSDAKRVELHFVFDTLFERCFIYTRAMSGGKDWEGTAPLPLLHAVVRMSESARQVLASSLDAYVRFLGFMLDPRERLIPEDRLREQWGWPSGSLMAVDAENW